MNTSVLKFLLSQYTARLFGSIRLHVAQNSNWKTLGKNSFHIEDAGNFGFGHLSKPFVTFRLFHFSSIFDCSRRTTKNDKEASRPLSEPPFFFRSAGWPDPSPILRIDTDRRFNHDALAEFPCSRETSQHMLFWNIIADPCSTCMRYYRSILLFWKFSRNRLDNTTWSTWSDYTSFSKCPRVIGTTRTHFHVGSS